MTEDKDLTRCGNNHGTTIGTDRTNGTSLPATADLPPVVRELVDGAPEKFRMPTFIACMAPWGCLATRLPDESNREMLQEAIESMELSTDYTVFLSKWNGKGFI